MSTHRHAISVGHAAPTLSCSHIPCHGMVHCATAPAEGAPTKRAGRQKRSRSWEPECQSHMPTSARHDDEQTGERLAALTRQGRDAMPEQGCDGEPFANTPPKKHRHRRSPHGKSLQRRREGDWKRKPAENHEVIAQSRIWISNTSTEKRPAPKTLSPHGFRATRKTTEVNHGSATRDIKKYDHSAGIEKWLHLA